MGNTKGIFQVDWKTLERVFCDIGNSILSTVDCNENGRLHFRKEIHEEYQSK